MDSLLLIDTILPPAILWAERAEREILAAGNPLAHSFLEDARAIGVKIPERIRLLRVERIPTPDDPVLQGVNERIGFISSETDGLTLRHGIYLRSDCWNDRQLIAHECVHVMQYERLGGFGPFLRQYLRELITKGYGAGELEQEAIRISARYT